MLTRRAILAGLSAACLALSAGGAPAQAPAPSLGDVLASVLRIKTYINPEARTLANLGKERTGAGIVIDESGLILTIGYLMVEAYAAQVETAAGRTVAAEVVGYDHDSGFGLLRAVEPLKLKPMPIGRSATVNVGDPMLAVAFGGIDGAVATQVVSKREFAGNWEYLLDEAIFTSPPHPAWSGAALVNREGKLVGVGSLIVGDASGTRTPMPGNMFVPIDRLGPILADLIAEGRPAGAAKPWLGVTTSEAGGGLVVGAVSAGGPAEKAGLQKGDVIVGVSGASTRTLADFYRKVWSQGNAGAVVPLDVLRNDTPRRIELQSIDRLSHLKLKSTF